MAKERKTTKFSKRNLKKFAKSRRLPFFCNMYYRTGWRTLDK